MCWCLLILIWLLILNLYLIGEGCLLYMVYYICCVFWIVICEGFVLIECGMKCLVEIVIDEII